MNTTIYHEIISTFIEGSQEILKVPRIPLYDYIEIFENKGFRYEFDYNGFQVDFWVTFRKNDEKVILSGDLWYTESWTLTKEGIE